MKHKEGIQPTSDFDERRAVEELKTRLRSLHEPHPVLPYSYWSNLLVRTNDRIDNATSVRAISISWAARVAIPGVVAILFFFIGLHYYVPDRPKSENSVTSMVNTLPQEAVDSILSDPERLGTSLSVGDVSPDIFQFSTEQISDYLLAAGGAQTVVENMSDNEVATLLSALDTRVHQ